MKYSIFINQKLLFEVAPDLKLKDAVILDYIKSLCSSPSQKLIRKEFEGEMYTWINYKHVMREMPILGLTTGGSISQAITRLEEFGFIRTKLEEKPSRKYICLTEKIDLLDWENTPSTEENFEEVQEVWAEPVTPFKKLNAPFKKLNTPVYKIKHPPFKKLNQLNNTNNKNIKNKSSAQSPELKKKKKKFSLSSVEEPKRKTVRQLTDPFQLRIFEHYQSLFNCGATKKTKALIEGIPRAITQFEKHFKKDAVDKLCESLTQLSKEKWVQPENLKSPVQLAPAQMFSLARIENYLLPLAFKPENNGTHLVQRPGTPEEVREIQEANETNNAERMARLDKRKATEEGMQ